MSDSVHYVNIFLGLGAIGLQVISVAALLTLVGSRGRENKFLAFIKENFLITGFLISFSALLVSLFYSEIVGYLPCFHCWVQRIFIFPQAIIFGIAWLRKDKSAFFYSLGLTLFGLGDSVFLMHKYYFNPDSAPCDASGVSCVQHLVSEFGGYISIPMLAFTGFFALAVLSAVVYFYREETR